MDPKEALTRWRQKRWKTPSLTDQKKELSTASRKGGGKKKKSRGGGKLEGNEQITAMGGGKFSFWGKKSTEGKKSRKKKTKPRRKRGTGARS